MLENELHKSINKIYLIKIIPFIILTLFSTHIVHAQCEVKKVNISQGIDKYFMVEQFYVNKDFENGVQLIFFAVNFIGDKSDTTKPYTIDIVVTYIWKANKTEMTPNQLKILLPSNNLLLLTAESKSRGTSNGFPSENTNSIECTFKLSPENIASILQEKTISSLIIRDYKQNTSIDLSSKYKGQLAEMISCVIK